NGRRIVAALNPPAEVAGIAPGLPVADARALLPSLAVADSDPAADAALLARIAEWCGRFSPWVAVDAADGIALDVTGCAHLFGGEEGRAGEAARRVPRLGFAGRVAIADTVGAAWGFARFGPEAVGVTPPGEARAALAMLPVAALRIPPETGIGLTRVGL